MSNFVNTAVGAVVGKVAGVWGDVREGVASAWKGIRDTADSWASSVVNFIHTAFTSLPEKLEGVGKKAGTALANALKAAVNAVIGAWNGFSIPSVSVMGKQVTPEVNFPNLPLLARGGITRGPSIAGEAGPEAVIPLGSSAQNRMDRARVLGELGGFGGIQIHIHDTGDPEATAQKVAMILSSRRLLIGGAF